MSRVKVNEKIYTIEKLSKTCAAMNDILKKGGCVNCKRKEQSIKQLCCQLTGIMDGQEITVS